MGFLQKLFGTKKQEDNQVGTSATYSVPDPTNEEDYVKSCTELGFTEEKEERTYRSDPEFQQVLNAYNSQDYSAAVMAAERVLLRFSDFDLPYKWLADACRHMDNLQRSHDVLAQGLARARRKSVLLTSMGETEWRMDNIHEAVYCWCQAIQCPSNQDYNAFLLLSYVARGCGFGDLEQRLLDRVDTMRGGQIRLDSATADRLTSLVHSKKNSAISRALQTIDRSFSGRNER